MRVKLLAFDSLGARSMSTFIETRDVKISIDPAVALGPSRYGLAPHPREVERLYELGRVIEEHAFKADVIVVTHYHYDHHDPGRVVSLDVYRDKTVLVKDPKRNINRSQRLRAARFLELISPLAARVQVADSAVFVSGETTIRFSAPVPHGPGRRLGYVLEVSVSDDREKLVYTSDVEGPCLREHVSFVLEERPELLVVDGPMTYMLGYRYSARMLEASIENLKRVVDAGVKTIVLDHHFMRDLNYRERVRELYAHASQRKVKVVSAAEYMGKPVEMLEALRKKLYEEEPVR